ncbi:zinc-binding dehydrogenase [Nocardioides sp. Kera G14]|uniref:zinc-binding dehydrogenase n=1 Tax=Nocardioides sp. Kera G14 TaxID=2884264 RepID=UPI001D12221A|nr:alcohol dehydrogenase catalytic domain-containing protein [Nocardioides sp. Kera G14]UDY25225.1 alcohol dehydrogenase catalytic domain-containing protein [Nocardioides sp. Kera G14]
MLATTLEDIRRITFREMPDPVIQHPTDAIVKVIASCICGSDLWPYRGDNGPVAQPRTIGHECLGEIVEVGPEVRDFRVGDTVVVPFDHCDNTCAHCLAGNQQACVNYDMTTSGQGELSRVAQADGSLVRIEKPAASELPDLLALSDVFPTGYHAAYSAGVTRGSTAVVVGDGAVGLLGVLSAKILGAERIIAMSRHESRQKLARTFGATDIVAARGEEGEAAVLDMTEGIGADAVLECVGTGAAMVTAFNVVRPGATVGFVGVPHGVELPVGTMFKKNARLAGGLAPVRRHLPDLLPLVLDGTVNPGLVFDSTLPMSQSAEGYRQMDEREAIKVFLTPGA